MQSPDIYTGAVRQIVHAQPWPKGFQLEVRQVSDAHGPFLQFVLSKENLFGFAGEDQVYLANLINKMLLEIHKLGIRVQLIRSS